MKKLITTLLMTLSLNAGATEMTTAELNEQRAALELMKEAISNKVVALENGEKYIKCAANSITLSVIFEKEMPATSKHLKGLSNASKVAAMVNYRLANYPSSEDYLDERMALEINRYNMIREVEGLEPMMVEINEVLESSIKTGVEQEMFVKYAKVLVAGK